MTTELKAKYLKRLSELCSDIEELRRVRMEVATSGTSSATLSTGDGSKSFTRQSIGELTKLMSMLAAERNKILDRMNGGGGIRQIYFVR